MRLALVAIVISATIPVAFTPPACAQTATASIVVEMPDGTVSRGCATVGTGGIDGISALRAAGFEVVTRDFGELGGAVCRIDGSGNDIADCPGAQGHWHYWNLVAGRWVEASQGPSGRSLQAADADGWTWSQGSANDPPPPLGDPGRCRAKKMSTPVSDAPSRPLLGWVATGVAGLVLLAIVASRRLKR